MSRKIARQHVFCVVFQFPFHAPLTEETVSAAAALYMESGYWKTEGEANSGLTALSKPAKDPADPSLMSESDNSFFGNEITGVYKNLPNIDNIIGKYLRDWSLDRIARVDLALLRLAVFEMFHSDEEIPIGASINEAVELAKLYGTDDAPAYVNGLLGQVARDSATHG